MTRPESAGTRVLPGESVLRVRRVRLEVTEGPDKGLAGDFDSDRISVGTAPGASLALTDRTVSRHHCEIEIGADGFLLRDLGSTNGTFVEGLRAREVFLRDGVRLSVGGDRILFRSLSDEAELELSAQERFDELVGTGPAMRRVFALLSKLGPRAVPVLLTGESGTGKELCARALHRASPRAAAPLVVVDCGGLPASLIEDELFGHERGAFTGADRVRTGAFERADGGTLFLDEVGELSLELQPKFLRALEAGEVARLGGGEPRKVDVRLVAATNRDLRTEVNRGSFRVDLYYRLSVVELRLPPLRERPEDIPALVRHFLERAERAAGTHYQIGAATLEKLQRQRWPGNVRELRNFVERTISLAGGPALDDTAAEEEWPEPAAPAARRQPEPPSATAESLLLLPFKTAKREHTEPFERRYLEALLARTEGNVSKAAREAGLDRAYLIQLLHKYDLK